MQMQRYVSVTVFSYEKRKEKQYVKKERKKKKIENGMRRHDNPGRPDHIITIRVGN